MNSTPTSPEELAPWLVVLGDSDETSLALWRIDASGDASVAFFTDRQQAQAYAKKHCAAPWRELQPGKPELISVLADCFQQGIKYATLNPDQSSARQVFVLRDVLKAAKEDLIQSRNRNR